jgi:hypothetical protein
MTTENLGHNAKFGLALTGNAAAATSQLIFLSDGVKKQGSIVERDGMRGTRSHVSTDSRFGPYAVGGQVVLNPTPEELAILFPLILGTAANGTSFVLGETLPEFMTQHDRVAKVFAANYMKVARATFSGSPGQPLQLALDLVGKTWTEANSGTFPSLTPSVSAMYMFHDCVLALGGTSSWEIDQFELVVDNGLITDRYHNSQTLTDIPEGDRMVSLGISTPYNSTYAPLDVTLKAAVAGTTGGTLTFTNGNYSTVFTFGALQVPEETPTIGGRGVIPLPFNFTSKKTGTTMELAVTHDSTA